MPNDGNNRGSGGITRRQFVGYLIAGPTLIAACGELSTDQSSSEAVPTVQPVDLFDLTDLLTAAAAPTANLIWIEMNPDGTFGFALPRAEVGQGITTATAMVIADEMGLRVDQVKVRLADARPELIWNQNTGGSNSMHSMFTPLRIAAAIARGRLLEAAAELLGSPLSDVDLVGGLIRTVNGVTMALADLVGLAAVGQTVQIPVPEVKSPSQWSIIGKPQPRVDAQAIVTGTKQFAMDLDVPGAMPTMLCRAPTINGSAHAVRNLSTVLAYPGVTDIAIIPRTDNVPGGVAVCARTFGDCITAIRALDVQWNAGSVDDKSDEDVLAALKFAELPMLPPLLADHVEDQFTFHFRPGDPLETNAAVANVRNGKIEVWACLKTPVWIQEQLALNYGLPLTSVTVHCVEGGGSFGRHLFGDAAFEAVAVSHKLGKPVKLMWHRTDNFRQGRVHPMATSRVRITYGGGLVLAYDQRHTSVATDFTNGVGELLTSMAATLPMFNSLGYSELVFTLTANVPYNFGPATQLLREIYSYNHFNTSSVRNIYSPDVCTAREVMVDRAARAMGQDEVKFRRKFIRDQRLRAVLDVAAQQGNWGRPMAPGTAQGMAVHMEYKGRAACLVEIDCTQATVTRDVPEAYTGPRVTKVVYVVDVGLPINPMGLEAQMMGGIMDGIAQALSYSLHLEKGHFLEGSWDHAFYTRQWNVPEVKVIVMPPTSNDPGGAGEFGVAATMAAVANAYARATGVAVNSFPLNHGTLGFVPLPTIPSIPESPTNGLAKAY